MQIELEDLDYQRRAIATVVEVLDGQTPNNFDNSNFFGIQTNVTNLTPEQIEANKRKVIAENGIDEKDAKLSPDADICIEMETGTGKTLVYLRTAYELYKEYKLTKFIILVPSIAIKEGVLASIEDFKKPLADTYGFTPASFEYPTSFFGFNAMVPVDPAGFRDHAGTEIPRFWGCRRKDHAVRRRGSGEFHVAITTLLTLQDRLCVLL